MNSPTRVFVWLEIYEGCQMSATVNYDDEIRFSLGDPFNEDRNIVFDRLALEQFVQLGSDALKLKRPNSGESDPPELVSVYQPREDGGAHGPAPAKRDSPGSNRP